MNIIDLRNQIDAIAWGPRGTDGLRMATTQASPAMSIKITFEDMKERDDLDQSEIEILRACCQFIRVNQWFGLVADATSVEAALPPKPAPVMAAIIGAGIPATEPQP
jgi:hypothetical protein